MLVLLMMTLTAGADDSPNPSSGPLPDPPSPADSVATVNYQPDLGRFGVAPAATNDADSGGSSVGGKSLRFFAVNTAKDVDCEQLNGKRIRWLAIAASGGVLTGASGLSSVAVPDISDGAKFGWGIGTLVLGAASAGIAVVAEETGKYYGAKCPNGA